MQFSQTLIANASDSSGLGIFGTLFWVFLVAAIVWLLIWLLLKSDGSGEGATRDSAQTTGPESTPAPESEAAPEPKQKPAKALPSQAFTIWTKPGAAPAPSKAKAKAETADKSKDETEGDATGADSIPELDTATAEEAAAQFQADLDSGKARQDEALGIVYDSAPDDADDLKEIKGVAKVLEGKLHDFGIYKFKQIAFWTDTAVAEFAQRLTFKDRIYRDDWVAQAKKFHEKKYGEKL